MAESPSPISGTDIGPIPGSTPSTSRKAPPDTADPVLENEGAEAELEQLENAAAPSSVPTNGATEPPDSASAEQTAERSSEASSAAADHKPTEPRTTPVTIGGWPVIDCSKSHEEVERSLYEAMKTKYGTTLVTDMDDAQLLLSYVTRNGLQDDRRVADDVIDTLIKSREQMRAGTFDAATQEAKFRAAYGAIATAAQPVSVASLRDSLMLRPYRPLILRWFFPRGNPIESKPIADIACLDYRAWAFIVLACLVVVQSYWTATSSILSKTDALIAEINKAPAREYYINQVNDEIARAAALKETTQRTEPTKAPSPPSAPSSEGGSSAEAPAVAKDKSQPTREELVSKIAERNANYTMLGKLMFQRLDFVPAASAAAESEPTEAERTRGQDPSAILQPSKTQSEIAAIRAKAVQVIDVLQKWLLPLLYGALGAMVFVVRTLSMQARDRLFRREALVALVLRVFLGMISGLAIGWFWTRDATAGETDGAMSLSSLSPFALAFVAGYGVELFFALLDKIVSTFTNKTA